MVVKKGSKDRHLFECFGKDGGYDWAEVMTRRHFPCEE